MASYGDTHGHFSLQEPEYFCPNHGNIGSWVFQYPNTDPVTFLEYKKNLQRHIQHYCPYCLRDLAIEYPDMKVSERTKLLDPVYPWTDELTKEDLEES